MPLDINLRNSLKLHSLNNYINKFDLLCRLVPVENLHEPDRLDSVMYSCIRHFITWIDICLWQLSLKW